MWNGFLRIYLVRLPHIHSIVLQNLSDRLRRLQREIYETLRLDSVERAGRTLSYGLLTAADYKFSLAGLEPGTEKYKEKQSEVHLRAAQRILYVCQRQGGVFVKAGQYISSLVKILPDEFTDTLRVLQDKNPGESFEDVCRVLEVRDRGPLSAKLREMYESEVAVMGRKPGDGTV
jgi:predicted unusual protein kinase regulating ubiquinone biosynthesis (AarF/ABC1/UbiB family)